MRGLSLVAASGGHSSSRCAGPSLSRPLLLRSTGSRCAGSVVVAHGPSRSAACGILPNQGSNPCPLHWQADSQPLRHQGNPKGDFLRPGCLVWDSERECFPELSGTSASLAITVGSDCLPLMGTFCVTWYGGNLLHNPPPWKAFSSHVDLEPSSQVHLDSALPGLALCQPQKEEGCSWA